LSVVSSATIHIEPSRAGSWLVRREADAEPLSEHLTATDAEAAARVAARRFSTQNVLLHDRYRRVREIRVSARG
jgi:hypothetical protein